MTWQPVKAVAVAVVVAVAAWSAAMADVSAGLGPGAVVMDVSTGLALVAGAAAATGPQLPRYLMGGAGVAWLCASSLPATRSLHQAALLGALVAIIGRGPRGVRGSAGLGMAMVIAVQVLSQPGVAVLFALVGCWALTDRVRGAAARWYPALTGAAIAAVLLASWAAARASSSAIDPALALTGYQVVLGASAVGFCVASRASARERAAVADKALQAQPTGLHGLATVLGQLVGDPRLRILRRQEGAGGYMDGDGELVAASVEHCRWLPVVGDDGPVAVVEHDTVALSDPATAAAVASAVLLVVTNERLQEQQRQRLLTLEAARGRLLVATDRVRADVAADLRTQVQPALHRLTARLAQAQAQARARAGPATAGTALEIAAGEVEAAKREIDHLVVGIAPLDLGGGRLPDALTALAAASPIRISLHVFGDVGADEQAETALFYACTEGVTNAMKHAAATRLTIDLTRLDAALEARVTDDGCGGADPGGSGLRGLADRLEACGGRLRVQSTLGAGTILTGTVPTVGRSASRSLSRPR